MVDTQRKPEQVTPTLADGGAPRQPTVTDKTYQPDQLGGLRRFALAITVFTLLGHFWFGFEQSYAQPLASVATAYIPQLLLEDLAAWLSIAGRGSPAVTGLW